MARFICLLFVSLLCFSLNGQNMIERDQYLFNQPGDSLYLMNVIKKDTFIISFLADQKDSTRQRQTFSGFGSWTVRLSERQERLLEGIQLVNGWEYRFENPIKLLPPNFKTWQSFSGETEFTAYYKGGRRAKGVFKLKIQVQNKDSARTPLRNFGDCIVLTTEAGTIGSGFPRLTYSIKEWYAREAGLVKLAGKYTTGSQSLKIATNLVKAQLQGEALEGKN